MSQCLSPQNLQAYLSESLNAEEMAAAQTHLLECAACQDAASSVADDSAFRKEFLNSYGRPGSDQPTASAEEAFPNALTMAADDVDTVDITSDDVGLQLLGRYELRRRIAKGGSGQVWEAYDPILERAVAIKLPRSDIIASDKLRQVFLNEGRKLALLQQAGIVRVYDVGEQGNKVFLVTELLTGGTLAERRRQAPLSLLEIARLIADVARAAHAAHRVGLIHRDIKPSNIVLDTEGTPRLADFGLAITVDLPIQSREFAGTVPYMSPEQAGGESLGPESDIYSLGVVIYELLTGTVPHRGKDTTETCWMIRHEAPVPPRTLNPAVPVELEAICLKCLEKSTLDRYGSAAELADALEAVFHHIRLNQAPPFNPASFDLHDFSTSLRLGRRGLLWMGAAAFGALGIGQFFWSPAAAVSGDARSVRVVTNPPGARIVAYPVDKQTGLPNGRYRVEGKNLSPVKLDLAPGYYLIVAAIDETHFHEVYRTVPENTKVLQSSYRHRNCYDKGMFLEWPDIHIPVDGIDKTSCLFDGSPRFSMGEEGNLQIPLHRRRIPPFYLDRHEVTVGEYRSAYHNHLPPSLATKEKSTPLPNDRPLSGIWWDDAVSYAEKVGKRLPTEAEYEYAATFAGTRRFPWGNSAELMVEWPFGPVGEPAFDSLKANGDLFGLYSNVPEWTASPAVGYPQLDPEARLMPSEPETFIVRGGPSSVVRGDPIPTEFIAGPRTRVAQHARSLAHTAGVRLARSVKPRLQPQDLEAIMEKPSVSPK